MDELSSCNIGSSSIVKAFILAALLLSRGGFYELPTIILFFIDS